MTSRSSKKRTPPSRPDRDSQVSNLAATNQLTRPARASKRLWWLLAISLTSLVVVLGGLAFARARHDAQVSALRRSCERAREDGDWPTLEQLARRWAILQPQKERPWTLAAQAARSMGDLQLSADYLSRIPDSASVEAFHELSLLQMEALKRPLLARDTCERALRIYPNDVESSMRLLFIHAMTCRRDALLEEARRAIEKGADERETFAYLVSARWLTFTNGYTLNQHWLEVDPDNETFLVASVAHLSLDQQKRLEQSSLANEEIGNLPTEQTIDLKREELLKRFPENVELLALRLNRGCQMSDVEEVGKLLNSAPARSADDNRFWRAKGWYHAANEEWDEADKAYRQALKLSPVDWVSQNELATVLRRSKGIEAAKEVLALAEAGKAIALMILEAKNFQVMTDAQYHQIADYFEKCGETQTAWELRKHLRAKSDSNG